MTGPYREGYSLEERRLAAGADDTAQAREVRSLVERRLARSVAGLVGVGASLATAGALVMDARASGASLLWMSAVSCSAEPPRLLLAGAAGSLATYAGLRLLLRAARSRGRPLATVAADLARPATWSFALPLLALSLLAPLTLHALVAAVLASGPDAFPAEGWLRGLSAWMRLSGAFVGHAHLAGAICAVVFAYRLSRADGEVLAAMRPARVALRHVGIVTAVAAVPGAIVILPPLITFVTGLAFVPFGYLWAQRTTLRERRAAAPREETRPDLEALEAARAALCGTART